MNGLYRSALLRDIRIHAFIAGYLVAAFVTAHLLGVEHKFDPLMYTGTWLTLLLQGAALVLVAVSLYSLRAEQPLRALWLLIQRAALPDTVAGLFMIVSLSIFSGTFTSFKSMLTDLAPFSADPMLAAIDAALHGGDAWRLLPLTPEFTRVIETTYFPMWTFLLLASIAAAVFLPALRSLRTQYIWTYMMTWVLLGNVVASLLMSGGPIYYEAITGSSRFAGLTDYLAENAPLTTGIRGWLWSSYSSASAGPATGISAFPSLHLALTTIFVLQARTIHPWLGWGGAVFGAAIMAGSVHLGWHYAIDGYFSIIATVVIWKVAGWRPARTPVRSSRMCIQPVSATWNAPTISPN